MEKKLRLYIETSVISHLDAPDRPDRMGETLLLWRELLAGKYIIAVGEPVLTELERCNEPKRTFMLDELDNLQYETLKETNASKHLATEYINIGGLPKKCVVDAMHIALATLANCDMIVSWNFSHIVNFKAMSAVNSVNASRNLNLLLIASPSSLLGGKTHG